MAERLDTRDLERVHGALLEALREVDAVCQQLGVAYWVDGGTLLGTVRHQGFIPWDDDVDLCMLRRDLARFLSGAPALLGAAYSVQTAHDDPAIGVDAKIFVNGTHLRSTYTEHHQLPPTRHDGLYIDVSIADPVSRYATVRRVDRGLSWLVLTRNWSKQMANSPNLHSRRTRLRWTLVSKLPGVAITMARRWLDSRARRRDHTLLAVGIAGFYNGWPYPRESIFPLKTGSFEGLSVPIPADPHNYLVGEYDENYMVLPPEGERVTHTNEVTFDAA